MTDLIATIGPRLKAERERRGLSSQKAADELHLDGWVVDALEAEDYERIGPSVYAKGHLKRYAALLGLPCAEIMASYESRSQAANAPASQPANVRLRTDSMDVSNLPLPQIAGSVAAVLLILGVLWWKPWHHRDVVPSTKAPAPAAPAAIHAESAATPAEAAPTPAPMPAMPGVQASSSPSSPPASAPPAPDAALPVPPTPAAAEQNAPAGMGRARLRLSFSADSWVDVHDAVGRRVFAGNIRAKSVRTIAGIAPMRVYLGAASGVHLEINNRAVAIGPQFVAGDAARFEAGADGVLRRDSRGAARGAAAPGVQSRNARPSG